LFTKVLRPHASVGIKSAEIMHFNVMHQERPSLVLVMPPQSGLLNGFATGLTSIADYIAKGMPGTQVQLHDLSQDPASSIKASILRRGIPLTGSTIVGITTTTASYQAALSAAAAFKSLSNAAGLNITTVLGGHHAGADAEVVLRSHRNTVDYVIIGEGEVSMLEFLRSFPDVRATPGLAYLSGDNYRANDPAPRLNERQLDSIPIAFKSGGPAGTAGKFGHVTYVSARGCPLGCAFCAVGNQTIRAKSVPRVIDDVRQLVTLGFSRIAIEDNFFAHTLQRTRELCEALAELRRTGLEFTWDCQTRVESMDREGLVQLMERAGCEAAYLGVESLNSGQLRYLNKAPNPGGYLYRLQHRVVPALLASNIQCFINLQFGLPGETEAHHAETKEILREMGSDASSHNRQITIFPQLHVLYPGTGHFRSGLARRPPQFPSDIFETFTAWEAKQAPVLTWLGKHFAHGTGGIPVGILNPEVLRSGRFAGKASSIVDPDAIMRIDSILTDLDELDGIRVFRYGRFLVGDKEPARIESLSEGPPTMIAQPKAACGT
jgi:radical SAM superfamily enzyme YgiQ (UPF0313 family)